MPDPTAQLVPGYGTLVALILVIAVSVWLGTLAQRIVEKGSFVKGFFLGNRGLGAWTLALTATVQSGGTFMGFPSLVYSHGWIGALFIASYMVVPITGFAVLGKRFAQLARRLDAITVPDLFRARFNSPTLGLVTSLLIMLFMSCMIIAQFKAGALVMKISWPGAKDLSLSEEGAKFTLSTEDIDDLAEEGVPDEILNVARKLKGQSFENGRELTARLREGISAEFLSPHEKKIVDQASPTDWLFYLGLAVFTLTVVGYTLIGGFMASVWTDLFQSVLMFFGVVTLLLLTIPAVIRAQGEAAESTSAEIRADAKSPTPLEFATRRAVRETSESYAFGPGYAPKFSFLPWSLACSFFVVWVFSGIGSPASMVRVMACKNTETMRKSIFLLSVYNSFIYLPLIVICIFGRALIPNVEKPDEIIPRLALLTTREFFGGEGPGSWFGSFVAGLILSAPFGAVMATVSSYLVVISSGLIRDVYQRFIRPDAPERVIRRLTYLATISVGAIGVLANIKPVEYLQVIVVASSTGAAASFLVPALMTAFWRRATAAGALSAMLGGAGTMISFYVLGTLSDTPFVSNLLGRNPDIYVGAIRPYFLYGLDPIVYGISVSAILGIGVSLCSRPPSESIVGPMFDAPKA